MEGWAVMARRKGSLWHDPLVVVGAEENNGDVVVGRNSALRGGPVGREFMHDNHDPRPYIIHVPLASRLGVDNSIKLAAGSLGDGVRPSEFPLPKGNPERTLPHPAPRSLSNPRR